MTADVTPGQVYHAREESGGSEDSEKLVTRDYNIVADERARAYNNPLSTHKISQPQHQK